jgi:hypothetical protein
MTLLRIAVVTAALTLLVPSASAETEWMLRVGSVLGKPGVEMPGEIYRVSFPRTDLKVTLDGMELKPGFAFGSWLAFGNAGSHGMVMGDLVLTGDEVNPVMTKLAENGIQVTALHNHLLRNEPATMYMHVLGHGDPVRLATAMRAALAESRTPLLGAPASAQPPPAGPSFDVAMFDRLLGAKGQNNGGLYQYSIARAERLTDGGMDVPAAMGSAIAINVQPAPGGKAAITGDFVLIAREVQPVVAALRQSGIEITALHNHMLSDEPRLFFMHFWAHDDAQKLAQGLRSALSQVNVAKSQAEAR